MFEWIGLLCTVCCWYMPVCCLIVEREAKQGIMQRGAQSALAFVNIHIQYLCPPPSSVMLRNAIIVALHVNSALDPHDLYAALWRTQSQSLRMTVLGVQHKGTLTSRKASLRILLYVCTTTIIIPVRLSNVVRLLISNAKNRFCWLADFTAWLLCRTT